jgi:hypothetical protein
MTDMPMASELLDPAQRGNLEHSVDPNTIGSG